MQDLYRTVLWVQNKFSLFELENEQLFAYKMASSEYICIFMPTHIHTVKRNQSWNDFKPLAVEFIHIKVQKTLCLTVHSKKGLK